MDTRCSLKEALRKFPDECTRSYEEELAKLVDEGRFQEEDLLQIINDYQNGRGSGRAPEKERIAYAAVYSLNILYRHNLDVDKFQKIADENQAWCGKHETFEYLKILCFSHIPEWLDGNEDAYLSKLYSLSRAYGDNPGYAHAFANLYALLRESRLDLQDNLVKRWGSKAWRCVERAIENREGYPLFYCTKGRLALLDGRYDEAEKLFQKAIRMEASSKENYALRIGQYRSYEAQARIMKAIAATNVQEELDRLKDLHVSNVEVVSFFAAVISFLLGSFSLAKGQTAAEAAVLIVILLGALLAAFSSFSALLRLDGGPNKKRRGACLAVGAAGVAIMAAGLAFLL